MELKDRIQQRLDALGLSPRAASLKAELNSHFLQAVLSGKSESPRGKNLERLAQALETTSQWLLTGAGDPDQPYDAPTAELINILPRLDVGKRVQVAEYARWLAEQKKREPGE